MSEYVLHFGPAHPAAHGVLRLMLWLLGEWCLRGVITGGLLHRGTEKLMEVRGVLQCIGYMDRLDYVSMLCNEHVFVLAVEHLYGIVVTASTSMLRCVMLEITRKLNHLLNIACHAGDLGCLLCVL